MGKHRRKLEGEVTCKCTWERELGREEVVMSNGMVGVEMEKVVEGSRSGKEVKDTTSVVEGICSSREDEEWEMVEEDFYSSKEVVEMGMGVEGICSSMEEAVMGMVVVVSGSSREGVCSL